MRVGLRGTEVPCRCVFRAIFRACYACFQDCVEKEKRYSTVTMQWCGDGAVRRCYGRRIEEYVADFLSVSRRALDEAEYRLFRYHYLLGADANLCCLHLNILRIDFYHEIYRVQETLGRAYRELRPYSLFPLDEYFGVVVRNALEPAQGSPIPIRRQELQPQPLPRIA